jgi:hypothetical protein
LLNETFFTIADESVATLSFDAKTILFALVAFANEKNTRETDTISARRKRFFFMVIGVFLGYWRHKFPKKKSVDERIEETLRKLYEISL